MEPEDKLPDALGQLIPDYDPILDEAALLDLFTARVDELMRSNLDLLLSSLYRLDVDESKIEIALHSGTVPAARGIASLIIERQKERIQTRKKYSSENKNSLDGH